MNLDRVRIFSHITQTRFLHIEDALERAKLRFFIGSFERGQGANNTAYAFLDVDEARVVMNDLAWGKPIDFIDRKGGKDGHDQPMGRVLKIKRAREEEKVWIELKNGVGEELPGGAVRLRGEAYAEISIPFTIHESRKMAFATLSYLQAWDVVRYIRTSALPTCNVSSVEYLRRNGQVH